MPLPPSRPRLLRLFALPACLAATLVCLSPPADAQDAETLRARHAELAPALARSPFQQPVVLQSGGASDRPTGDVYAVIAHPYRVLGSALARSRDWCDILTLPANVKRCSISGQAPQQLVTLAVGRKFDQPVEDAYQLAFKFSVAAADERYLRVQMAADQGPMGTRAYRLSLEAVPLDARHSFVHLSYAYTNGFAAQLATQAYLATAGRSKVGFTVTGQDNEGQPLYIDGVRGIAERNTMRYFLAIESYLDTLSLPASQRAERRLQDWFSATERYPRQLREMAMDEYLAMKRRELRQLTASGAAEAG